MAKPLRKDQEIEFVPELPPKGGGETGRWANHLLPLLENPHQWALVFTCNNVIQANKLQSNLHSRQVLIPEPYHEWQFAARGCEVFAIYRGKKNNASIRRVNRER